MPKILLVKTSSMGDVIHNLPVVSDIRNHFPEAQIDWVAEESFAAIPALHPGVAQVLPVALRRWRKKLFDKATQEEIRAAVQRLQAERYDIVLDTQGLLKSAVIARLAQGSRAGLAWNSAREPLAALFYDYRVSVEKNRHAVERNRLLAGKVLGYAIESPVDYGITAPNADLPWLPDGYYTVFLHATSRDDKLWPESHWVALGAHFNAKGLRCILPWGSATEQARAERLAAQIPHSIVAPRLTLDEAASLLARADVVIGVDTGLAHFAAALNVPVVALYCSTEPGLTGVYAGSRAVNLGGIGKTPDVAEVIATADKIA
ncbi:MAG: lipopolysaccharide heptosyltransferase I [Sulfuricella sp.]|nr:lipopolysaccharide heptosyltransferase I [Sulfuricella sp.]